MSVENNTNEILNIFADFEDEQKIVEESEKYLTFYVAKQLFALPSSEVIEMITMQPITYIPSVPSFVKGVINIRGKVVPLVELETKLKGTSAVYNRETSIVVVEIGETHVGFIVDKVEDVTDVYKSQIGDVPKTSKKETSNEFVLGMIKFKDSVAMILNCKTILDLEEIDELK